MYDYKLYMHGNIDSVFRIMNQLMKSCLDGSSISILWTAAQSSSYHLYWLRISDENIATIFSLCKTQLGA